MHTLYKTVIILFALLIFMLLIFVSSFNFIVKTKIEKFIENITSLPTTIEYISLNPFKSEIEITRLTITNLQQFDDLKFLDIKTIKINFNILSLFGERVLLDEVIIKDMKINLEVKNNKNNYNSFIEILDTQKNNLDAKILNKKKRKFNISKLLLLNLDLHTKIGVIEASGIIERFEMQNVGNYRENSIELVNDVIRSIYHDALKRDIIKTDLDVGKTFDNIKNKIKSALNPNLIKSVIN